MFEDKLTVECVYYKIYAKKKSLFLGIIISILSGLALIAWAYYRDLWVPLFIALLLGVIACGLIRGLFRKDLLYIITKDGILDCRFGFVSWDEVTRVAMLKTNLESDISITLKLLDSKKHYGGTLRSYFGTRELGVYTPLFMRYEKVIYDENNIPPFLHLIRQANGLKPDRFKSLDV